MTEKEPTLEEMAEQIEMTQKKLAEMKKAYHEKKYASYNAAREAFLVEHKALYGKELESPLTLWYKW